MKKLLITTMAAVSVGLCAKAADDGFISGTSFEDVSEGAYLEKNEKNGTVELCNWYDASGKELSDIADADYWMTEATDAQLVVSNLSMFADVDYLPNADRPQKWSDGTNTRALYIDTDKPLMRYVNQSIDGITASGKDLDQDIFFDSVVQFTATDVAAEPDSADKLRVWLYTSPDDVSETNLGLFDETSRKTCLVVTAGKYDGDLSTSNLKAEHYEVQIEGVELQPDTWHRLTIKAIADIDLTESATPGFEIWVDGKPVTYGADKKTQFPSLKEAVPSGKETLQCVAFDGKGAVDDIVFTTTEPEFAKESEAEKVNVSVTINDFAAIMMALFDGSEVITSGSASYEFEKGSTHSLQFMLNDGYELVSSSPVASNEGGYYTITVEPNSDVNVEIVVRKAGGGDVVTYPTVKPNGDSITQETLSASAVAAIEAALAGVETMPDALTVIVNEKEYFGDEAVAKINEVVEMFEAAEEGATLKFFNDEGEMIVSFKAKNPFMETETAEATDYEAMVGESAATVTSKYTVNKETVDLTPGVAGENEAVTFKLVIKPVSSTGSDTGLAVQE